MDKPASADSVEQAPLPTERQARHPEHSDDPIGVDLSQALSLRQEFEQLFGHRQPPTALPAATQDAPALLSALRSFAHALPADQAPAALCLSGGGIRSATFGLGVLQGLARNGLLARFDYLSTVSGGGYIGCWLTAWLRRERERPGSVFGILGSSAVGRRSGLAEVPPPADPRREPEAVHRLRAYSNYLSPATGIGGDLMALVAIFGRNLFLHWLVLLPALLAVLMLPRLYLALLDAVTPAAALPAAAVWGATLFAGCAGAVGVLASQRDMPFAGCFALAAMVAALWGLAAEVQVTLGALLFALATLAVGLSIAYMAADLPEVARDDRRSQAPLPPDRFWRFNHAPLVAASLLYSLLVPWVTSAGALEAAAAPALWLWPRLDETAAALLVFGLGFGALHLVAAFIGMDWRLARGLAPRRLPNLGFQLAVTVVVGAIGGAALLGSMIGLSAWWHSDPAHGPLPAAALAGRERFAMVAAPAMLAVFWLTVTLYAGLTRRLKSEEDREWWARAAGMWLLSALAWSALVAAVTVLPPLLFALADALGFDAAGSGSLAGGATLLGVAASAWGYWSRNGQKIIDQVQGLAARLNARLLDLFSALVIVLIAAVLGLALSLALELVENHGLRAAATTNLQPAAAASATAAARPAPTSAVARQVALLAGDRLRSAEKEARCRPKPGAASAALPAECAEPVKLSAAQAAAATYRGVLHRTDAGAAAAVLALLALTGWLMAHFIGTNTFSLHSLYGNRLIRAYLGASNPREDAPATPGASAGATPASRRRPHRFTGFDPQDNVDLAEVAGCRPFLVINAALNLVQPSGERLEWQQRKAASFTFTPLSCGSPVLGYAPTADYGRKPVKPVDGGGAARGGLSVGRAMAISGAAASPNMGYHSSVVVAFVMSFFNVRLGWWMPNPRVLPGRSARQSWARDEPPAASTLVAETLARTREDSEFVYLSDGGHFENLGLYEMVRRRCRRILVVDATRDPAYQHEDLLSSLRKIRIDLGISIDFPNGLPTASSCERGGKPWAVGRIHYADADAGAPTGSVVYLKPAMWPGLPPDVRRYAETSSRRGTPFPHQSTGDQFFDEAQFESYRLLGLLTALEAFGEIGRWPPSPGPDHAVRAAAAPPAPRRSWLRAAWTLGTARRPARGA